MKEEELVSLRQQVQTLVHQDRVRQEELARCRAQVHIESYFSCHSSSSQVASLSAELAVERQMVDEIRKELAETRAGKVIPAFSLPPPSHLPSFSHTIPPATLPTTNGTLAISFPSTLFHSHNLSLPPSRNSYPPPPPSSGHSSIIHI